MYLIILPSRLLNQNHGFYQLLEGLSIKQFVPKFTVKLFNITVFPRDNEYNNGSDIAFLHREAFSFLLLADTL